MIWLSRFLIFVGVSATAMTGYIYGKTGELIALGVGILAVIIITVSACLFAETRYFQGYVAGMRWLKQLWEK